MHSFIKSKVLLTTLFVIISSQLLSQNSPVTVSDRNYIQKDIIEFKDNNLVLRDNSSLSRKQLRSVFFTNSLKNIESLFTGQTFRNEVTKLFSKIDVIKENHPNDNLILIENNRSYELLADGSILQKSTKFYYCRRANLVHYKQLDFPIGRQNIPLKLTAICHSKNGEIVNLIDKNRYKSFDNIRVRQNLLLDNSIIVTHSELLEQTTWHKQLDLRVSFPNKIPTVENNLTVTVPKGVKLISSTPSTKMVEVGGKNLMETYSWSPNKFSNSDKLSITTFKNWTGIAAHYHAIVDKAQVLSEVSQKFFEQLLSSKPESQSTEEFIYRWIQSNIALNRVAKTLETLQTAEETLKLRIGTTSEKNLLFCAVLNALKVNAQLLLFSQSDDIDTDFPTEKLTGTVVSIEKPSLFVTLANNLTPMEDSADELDGKNYLNLKSKTIQTLTIDHTKKRANIIKAEAVLDTENQLINITVNITLYGNNQVTLRRILREMETKQQLDFINKEFFKKNCVTENISITGLKKEGPLKIIANHSLQSDVFKLAKNKYAIYLPNLLRPFTNPCFSYKNQKISGEFKLRLKKGNFQNKIAKTKNRYADGSTTLFLSHSMTGQELEYSFELELKDNDSLAILNPQIQSLIQPFLISVN